MTQAIQMTRERFFINPRSRELREVSLELIRACETLMYKQYMDSDQLYASIEHLNGVLVSLGITADMNAGLPREAYQDVVTVAERAAGQLLTIAGAALITEQHVTPIFQEWSEARVDTAYWVSLEHLPQPVQSFLAQRHLLKMVKSFLDYQQVDEGNV